MQRILNLNIVTEGFNPKNDVPIGPWCFQDAEHIYPDWDKLDFINPFDTPEEMEEASHQTAALFETFIPDFKTYLNALHGTSFSAFSWRHLLTGWHILLIQVSYVRFLHIKKFIALHKNEKLDVKIAPKNVKWTLEISHSLSQLVSRSDFDYWLSSLIIRELAPDHWTLIEDQDFQQECTPENQEQPESPPSSLRTKLRDKALSKIDSGRFDFIYGTAWRSQLFFCFLLNLLSAQKRKNTKEALRPLITKEMDTKKYFSDDYLRTIDFLNKELLPQCFKDPVVFKKNLEKASKTNCQSGKIRVIGPDILREVEKLKTVLAHEAGEKIITTQHGCWYGNVSCAAISHMAEYTHRAFFSWGWKEHLYEGNYIPLPSPLLTRVKKQRVKALKGHAPSSLLLVDNIVNLRSARIEGQPMPAEIIKRRYDKKKFVETLTSQTLDRVIFRPHIHHTAGIDEVSFMKKHFKNLNILTSKSMDETLLRCKLFVSNHYGTTLHIALAANIPTVCYWDNYPPLTPKAQQDFEKLKAQKILFDSPEDAAKHINDVWDNLDEWWQSPDVQRARKDWCYEYARTSPLWLFHWIRALIRL